MGYSISGTFTSLLPASNPTPKYTLSASIQRNHIPLVTSTTTTMLSGRARKIFLWVRNFSAIDIFLVSKFSGPNGPGWIGKKTGKRLIRISTAEGKWQGNWNADYNFSLRDLRLDDLVEDGDPNNSRVLVSLTIHRHAGFGLSVDGKVDTSFTRKCSNCSLPYRRQITTNFNVWILSSNNDGGSNQLPEIGGDDPSVIYVKPGCEADLDSLIQDTVRLTTSVNETCSDACDKSELGLKNINKAKAPTVDKRWSKLLELKNSYQ